ncbi:hypothetical protein HIM_02877 [Hirsutella minnesotensis 3608]|nr:hypothetical protein HIM_02877 [Hirsutella minnesotensis 3608]
MSPLPAQRRRQASAAATAQTKLAYSSRPVSSTKQQPFSHPTTSPDSETSLPEQLRSVMRLLASPVVVCTATHGSEPRAMTMSSFTSLTLTPTPLITFNVATPSRTLDAIASSREAAGRLC